LGIKCSNCGGTHPTDRCRNPDKVIPLNLPPGNYQQQAKNNVQGAKLNVPSMDPNPSSLFYDHQNHRQTHHPPTVVQTRQGVIDLAPLQYHGQNHNVRPVQSYPSTQDVRLVDSNQAGPSTMNQEYVITLLSNLVQTLEIKENKAKITLVAPTLAVTTRAKTLAMPILEESSDVPSKDSPQFSELDEVLKEARKNVKKAKAKENEPPPLELN